MPPSAIRHLSWDQILPEQLNPNLSRRFVSGEQTTIAQIHLKKGCIVPLHSHPNEQISTVLSGRLRFTFNPGVGTEEYTVSSGEVLIIPGGVPHSAEALEDTINVDFFAPCREDWISGSDAYLRQNGSSSE